MLHSNLVGLLGHMQVMTHVLPHLAWKVDKTKVLHSHGPPARAG